jgi:hypothetical protein
MQVIKILIKKKWQKVLKEKSKTIPASLNDEIWCAALSLMQQLPCPKILEG